jgi:hypothetical protein
MYNYVGSDPVNGRDPTGLSVFCNAISYNSNTTVEGIPPARLTKSECSSIPYPGLWASVGGDLADRDRQNEWEQNLAALVADANAAVPGAGPQKTPKKGDPISCTDAARLPGKVLVGAIEGTYGIGGSYGKYFNDHSYGNFRSDNIGLPGGAAQVFVYDSMSSLVGRNISFSVALFAQFTASFDTSFNYVAHGAGVGNGNGFSTSYTTLTQCFSTGK